jgi:hypothetical protein
MFGAESFFCCAAAKNVTTHNKKQAGLNRAVCVAFHSLDCCVHRNATIEESERIMDDFVLPDDIHGDKIGALEQRVKVASSCRMRFEERCGCLGITS